MGNKFAIITGIFIAVGAVLGGLFGKLPVITSADNAVTGARILADYRESVDVVEKNYVSTVDHEKITDSSIQGLLWTLDPHSAFFTRDEFQKLTQEQASEFYGIGVSILQHRGGVFVQSVVPGTPADKAGLRYGDKFLQVDGKDAAEWSSAEVSKNVRGEKGTPVKVKVERAGSPTPVDFEIVRGGVPLPSIRNYFLLPNGVGYVGLTGGFQETTSAELGDAIGDLQKQGMKSLILDLRGNPGGILEQAIAVMSRFIPSNKTVVSVKGRANYSNTRELRTSGGGGDNFPLVVMINGGSASASEIVAGAVQDYGRGIIVGSDSFGKGLVQRVFRMPYGTGLTLTTARYYTPFGRSLQRDYSSGSIYDYYSHHEDEEAANGDAAPKPAGVPITTPDGRTLFGGRGLEPEVKVKPLEFTPARGRVSDAAFFFVRQMVAGKIGGFENYKVEKQSHAMDIQPDKFRIDDRMFEAFKAFAIGDKLNGLSAANIDAEAEFVRTRLRLELATANYSNEAGIRVLLEVDPQILKAVEVLPEAKKLADLNLARK
ncbi:MAG: S41 family peptidase [Pyrinomonadaceae bacterium]